ncbi:MAG: hypothetical protein HHJ16_07170 [Polaromonas sp.]|uniref:hypothetical protein n=1 Tax=Polaromonas sp. TaxID=1869339 RepID=UPI00185C6B0B|nr:hypothetical protein [Polaromonas sp.]NMM10038.1 hypothetical protein [Polaromonas sp.]
MSPRVNARVLRSFSPRVRQRVPCAYSATAGAVNAPWIYGFVRRAGNAGGQYRHALLAQ